MVEIRALFSTPFVIDTLQSAEGLRQLCVAIEAERARDADGVGISNIGGWHSNTQMIDWGGEAARALAYKAMTMADAQTVDLKSRVRSRYEWRPEMWANISGAGNANQYHCHPGSYWSAVAYVDDGYDGDDNVRLGGELQLLDPRMLGIAIATPGLVFDENGGDAQRSELSIRPRTGMIVLFPSWLQHAVRPFGGGGTRISIALNLTAVLPAEPRS